MRSSLVTAAVLAILLAACGGGGGDTASKATTTTKPGATTSTTEATDEDSTTTTTTVPGGTVKPTGAVDPGGYGWLATAFAYRGLNGKQLEFGCPPGGQVNNVYGTDIYTDDSYVCTAGVHSGKITQAAGGQVVVTIQPGQASYKESQANGVNSIAYEQNQGSFEVVSGAAFRGTSDPQTGGYGWDATATPLRGLTGQKFAFACPPAGNIGFVYGTGTYTDDSSICSAATHAGKITRAVGGTTVIEIKGEQSSFEGSVANGVTSNEYGVFPSSFSFAA